MTNFKLGDTVVFIPSKALNKGIIKDLENKKLIIRAIESSVFSGQQAIRFYGLKSKYTSSQFELYTKVEYKEEL